MTTQPVEVPEELLSLLERSRLTTSDTASRVTASIAIQLFIEGVISIGKAAELAGVPRVEFEWRLVEMGLPTVHYDVEDYEEDRRGLAHAGGREMA